jgi:microcystin-dependent protein
MSQPFVGEIRLFAGNFAPEGWATCDGQLIPISENPALFDLIGTIYGGDGQETFALPDLRGRVPVHQGNSFTIGQLAGSETETLTTGQMPAHRHPVVGSGSAGGSVPSNALVAASAADTLFTPAAPDGQLAGTLSVGGNQPHNNLMSYNCVNYIISLFGIFPTQT